MTCTHAPLRNGTKCAEYRAPTLWCSACRPALAANASIDISRWPDWRYLSPAKTHSQHSGEDA